MADKRDLRLLRVSVAQQFGANLRAARTRAGLTQGALALRAGTHHAVIGQLEAARRGPRLETVAKLASALNLPVEELVAGISVPLR
ncbi:MAG TPA: helix-turn-helix transcriptional regulator [Solirubrobacterales bacterium]|nr:helix-turn-helix transcriptional regulator [Solirubrobacterales bacterium]